MTGATYKVIRPAGHETFSPAVDVSLLSPKAGGDVSGYTVFPGFCDVHVHFREPGFSYKETIRTGSLAAAHGGFTDVCTMPNLDPVPEDPETLKVQLDLIRADSLIRIRPYGSITKGEKGLELSDLSGIFPDVAGFTDDGRGVQSEDMMREAMKRIAALGGIVAAHCEDETGGIHLGVVHKGEYARLHGLSGISSESEWHEIERDIRLSEETGCAFHVCHISTKEGVELIRKAKKRGANVSCETAPHYLLLNDMDIQDDGRFKMKPPIRSKADQEALIEGLLDGTIEMIATDHAPHSAEEKSKGLSGSAFGIVGLENCFPSLYTGLVKTGILSLEKLTALMTVNPRKRFHIPFHEEDYTVFDLNAPVSLTESFFLGKSASCPFLGQTVYGKCLLTSCGGRIAYRA